MENTFAKIHHGMRELYRGCGIFYGEIMSCREEGREFVAPEDPHPNPLPLGEGNLFE